MKPLAPTPKLPVTFMNSPPAPTAALLRMSFHQTLLLSS